MIFDYPNPNLKQIEMVMAAEWCF